MRNDGIPKILTWVLVHSCRSLALSTDCLVAKRGDQVYVEKYLIYGRNGSCRYGIFKVSNGGRVMKRLLVLAAVGLSLAGCGKVAGPNEHSSKIVSTSSQAKKSSVVKSTSS